MIRFDERIEGLCLDLGGGGEGVITQAYPGQVVAVDLSLEELLELPTRNAASVMDAAALAFPARSFRQVTAFYALLFMDEKRFPSIFSEAYRVLRPGGRFYIWDLAFEKADPATVSLAIDLGGKIITPSFGVYKESQGQSPQSTAAFAREAGFSLLSDQSTDKAIQQVWVKK